MSCSNVRFWHGAVQSSKVKKLGLSTATGLHSLTTKLYHNSAIRTSLTHSQDSSRAASSRHNRIARFLQSPNRPTATKALCQSFITCMQRHRSVRPSASTCRFEVRSTDATSTKCTHVCMYACNAASNASFVVSAPIDTAAVWYFQRGRSCTPFWIGPQPHMTGHPEIFFFSLLRYVRYCASILYW